jgi:hypothetical protein
MGKTVAWDAMAEGFETRFAEALGLDARKDGLTGAESELIREAVPAKIAAREEWMAMAGTAREEGKIHA